MDCDSFRILFLLVAGEIAGYNISMKDVIKRPEIQFWIPILTALVGVAVSWGIVTSRVDSLEERFNYFGGRFAEYQEKTDGRFESVSADYFNIQVTLAEIQKDIAFIKERLQ